MLEESQPTPGGGLDVQLARQALACLYSNPELARSELVALFPDIRSIPDVQERAQAARNLLLKAIEALRVHGPLEATASASRSYKVLLLRHVSGLQIEQIAERLNVGERQVYRDLRRAEEELTRVLEARASPAQTDTSETAQDIRALAGSQRVANVREIVEGALATIEPLANSRQVRVQLEAPDPLVPTLTVPGILKQVLTQLLSAVIQSSEEHELTIELDQQPDELTIKVPLPGPRPLPREQLLQTALSMARAIEVRCELVQPGQGDAWCRLALPALRPQPVLIVEDNPEVRELYQRYLHDTEWQVVIAPDATTAGEVAATLRPAAIILDILLPDTDGWHILQMLQMDPDTADIPTIICSVIDDPELATALGAAGSLKKPVARQDLLRSLRAVVGSGSAA
jgi:CheY-like chemotaxis protein